MNGWLLDIDALSAFAPGKPAVSPDATAWFEERGEALFLSAITAMEIAGGIAKLERTGAIRRAAALRAWFEAMLASYADRVLPFDLAAARVAGPLADLAQAAGRHPGFADIAIAAIATSRELVLVTLNRRHFEPLGIAMVNPLMRH